MSAERARGATLLAAALLALAGATVAVRAVRFARDPGRLDALDERRWHGFANRGPWPGEAVAAAAPRLLPGETVWVLAPRGTDRGWLLGVALYHLPAQRVRVAVRGDREGPPPGATVVVMDRRGRAEVVRGGHGGR